MSIVWFNWVYNCRWIKCVQDVHKTGDSNSVFIGTLNIFLMNSLCIFPVFHLLYNFRTNNLSMQCTHSNAWSYLSFYFWYCFQIEKDVMQLGREFVVCKQHCRILFTKIKLNEACKTVIRRYIFLIVLVYSWELFIFRFLY